MIDRLFFAALALAITLTLGTAAVTAGQELWEARQPAPTVVQLPTVVVVGKRPGASAPLARADATQPALRSIQ